LLTSGNVVGVGMRGTIYSPAYIDINLPNGPSLTIPSDPTTLSYGVSPDNTFFTCSPANVTVNFATL
jgi:hypothetical protein